MRTTPSDGTPDLRVVRDAETTQIEEDGITWYSAINGKTVGSTAFEYGRATAESGRSVRITPVHQFDERTAEVAALTTRGQARVTAGDSEWKVSEHDCLFVPLGTGYAPTGQEGYALTGVTAPVSFVWCVAAHDKPPLYGESASVPEASVQVVRTHTEIDPRVSYDCGNTSRRWEIVYPETVGSTQLNVGLFQRPPGSGMPVRGHAPPTISEAFTVLEGRMQVTAHDGSEYVLERDDFLYVPPDGKHANMNVGSDTLTYTCVETPARSRTVSPSP